MYETPDSLTKYLPEKYSRAVQFAQFGRQTRIVINNRVNDFIPNPTFERVAAPGAHEKFFAGENTEGLTLREMQGPGIDAPAATRNPVARVAELDRQGVVEVLNYPTLASLIEHATADDPELTLAVIHALNQWMLEHWTYNYEKPRVLDADHQSLGSRRRTARARVPPRQRRQGRIDQTRAGQRYSGLAITSTSGVRSVLAGCRGRRPADRVARQLSPARRLRREVGAAAYPELHGAERIPVDGAGPPRSRRHDHQSHLPRHADRFPRLRIASVENGSSWIHPLLGDFEDLYRKMPQNFPEHPHDVFRRNIWVSPFWEGCVADVVETVGWDRVLFGSDYPIPKAWQNRGDSGSTPKAWMHVVPTTSWATTRAGSWACRSPTRIPQPSSRRPWRTRTLQSEVTARRRRDRHSRDLPGLHGGP